MSRSPSRSTTSAVIASLVAICGCKTDETCGIDGASDTFAVTGTGVSLSYNEFVGGANNDCPDPDAPSGVVSISVIAQEVGGTGFLTICIPRIDLLGSGDRTIGGSSSTADVRIFDVDGTTGGCTITLDTATPPTGTATGSGVCANGNDSRGFALDLDANVTAQKNCAGAITLVPLALSGTVAVLPQ